MKIIQLIYSLSSGGAERFVVNLSNALHNLGYDVTICMLLDDSICALTFNQQFLSPEVSLHSMNFSRGISSKKILAVDNYIRSQAPDVVHCHLNVTPYIYALTLRNRHIRFVHTLHSLADKTVAPGLQYYLNRFFYSKGYILPVTISEECQESFKDYYKLDNSVRVDNGAATAKPTNSYQSVAAEIESLRLGTKVPVFVHVARFHQAKNQMLLIDSFNELDRRGIPFQLLIIGAGFDSPHAQGLIRKACDRIHFLGEKSNVSDYLLCADYFCLSSNYEGLPISLLEALSAGVTPVCTAVGGIKNVLIDGQTGYLSNDLSVESYVGALLLALQNPLDRNLLKNYFNDNFSIDHCAQRYLQIYKS